MHYGAVYFALYTGILIISTMYKNTGFLEKAIFYGQEALKLDGDSVAYYVIIGTIEYRHDNLEKAIEFFKKGYAIDSI